MPIFFFWSFTNFVFKVFFVLFFFVFLYKFCVLHNQMSFCRRHCCCGLIFGIVFVSFSIIKYFFYQIMACLHHNKQKLTQIWHWAIYSREDFWLDVFCKFPVPQPIKLKGIIYMYIYVYEMFLKVVILNTQNSIQFSLDTIVLRYPH